MRLISRATGHLNILEHTLRIFLNIVKPQQCHLRVFQLTRTCDTKVAICEIDSLFIFPFSFFKRAWNKMPVRVDVSLWNFRPRTYNSQCTMNLWTDFKQEAYSSDQYSKYRRWSSHIGIALVSTEGKFMPIRFNQGWEESYASVAIFEIIFIEQLWIG